MQALQAGELAGVLVVQTLSLAVHDLQLELPSAGVRLVLALREVLGVRGPKPRFPMKTSECKAKSTANAPASADS